jgi:hypothetical protein
MLCADKKRLQAEWITASNAYAKLVKALTGQKGKLQKDEYDKKRKAVEAARVVSEALARGSFAHSSWLLLTLSVSEASRKIHWEETPSLRDFQKSMPRNGVSRVCRT